jgi:1,4-alpha-glucan branching enzyme
MSTTFLERPADNRYSAKSMTKPISFFFSAPEAESVYLMGDFNGWSPNAHAMQRRPDGWWLLQVPLTHGHHQYLFLVDGRPTLDPHASGTVRNERYRQVSLLAVS